MTSYERAEIKRLPKQYRPLTAIEYILYAVLYSLPLVGVVLLIWHSMSSKNINRRSYARSCILLVVLYVIFIAVIVALMLTNVINYNTFVESTIPDMGI